MLTATVSYTCVNGDEDDENDNGENGDNNNTTNTSEGSSGYKKRAGRIRRKDVKIHHDNVGFIYDTISQSYVDTQTETQKQTQTQSLEQQAELMEHPFALPTPARESLLSLLITLLTKDYLLRAVSNTSFHPPDISMDIGGTDNNTNNTNDHNQNQNQSPHRSLLLVIQWRSMLRMLMRTSPYLDELKTSNIATDSLSRQSTILKRTVLSIRYMRKFYNQGLQVKENVVEDTTAKQVWEMVRKDLLYQTHTNATYRALIVLYLFQPSRCSVGFYQSVCGLWLDAWTRIDRCPDLDYLYLTLFCRARKYLVNGKNTGGATAVTGTGVTGSFQWGTLRKRLLTLCGYWLQIPVGGTSSDSSFPVAGKAKSRSIPGRLKAFVGNPGSYQEGVDFVSKLSKLLMFCLGKCDIHVGVGISVGIDGEGAGAGAGGMEVDNMNVNVTEQDPSSPSVSDGTEDVLRFLSFVAPYFHPSNTGAWTFPLGVLLHYISYEFCRRIAIGTSQVAIAKKYPLLAQKVGEIEPYKHQHASESLILPHHEIVLMLDALLPLCQQTLYSKSSQVARAGESALLYLTQIDHKICPMFLDFAMRALDISSVTLSHQAPAALSALSRLVPPSLKTNPIFLLERLPEILRLTLAGIDGNDQSKTIRTLIFYRTVASWLPIGKPMLANNDHDSAMIIDRVGNEASDGDGDGLGRQEKGTWVFGREMPDAIREISESKEYWAALRNLPKNSLLYQAKTAYKMENEEEKERLDYLMEEAAYSLGDWVLLFLERIYDILRAAGEQEKTGKSHGIASRHSSADASDAKHFTMLLKQCLSQVFSAMDDTNFDLAARSVQTFLQSETLPLAVKYASILCEAVCATRSSSILNSKNCSAGLDILLPLLVRDLSSKSNTTILYRVRCLAGAIRQSGSSALKHKNSIISVLRFTLFGQSDKKIFKAGCKMLRHLLASQCESYPIASDSCARLSGDAPLGKPSRFNQDHVRWHVPTGGQIDFAVEILSEFTYGSISSLSTSLNEDEVGSANGDVQSDQKVDLMKWRKCLKILRYSLRGCSGVLLEDKHLLEGTVQNFDPHEIAMSKLVHSASETARQFLSSARSKISNFIVTLLSLIASGSQSAIASDAIEGESNSNGEPKNSVYKRSVENIIASDVKICKEGVQISIILSTRRGSNIHSQDAKSTWKLQEGLADDRVLSTTMEEISTVLRKAGLMKSPMSYEYKDGEEGGKSYPRRMIVQGAYIFLQTIQRQSSFQIPRRLREEAENISPTNASKLFAFDTKLTDCYAIIESSFRGTNCGGASNPSQSNLRLYEKMIDGGFALACHTNASIRSNGSRMVEHLFTRFGWFAEARVSRLLSSLALNDSGQTGKYGLLSSAEISADDSVSSRKRLAEILKGVSNVLHLSKINKEILQSEQCRLSLVKAMCKSQRVITLLPADEIKKMTHYYHGIFSKYRSRHCSFPRIETHNMDIRREYLDFVVGELRDEGNHTDKSGEMVAANWRDRLTCAWFLLTFLDEEDIICDNDFADIIWDTCFKGLKEAGQPLQKLSLGLIGRMATLFLTRKIPLQIACLQSKLSEKDFCIDICKALVFNHKEDGSVGGGHQAQWSIGVSSMLKDAQANIAPRTVFPFKRMGRSSGNLLVSHCQLISSLLQIVGKQCAVTSARHFLSFAEELSSSPPSEDQRNQLCTSAEIFAGISRGLLTIDDSAETVASTWSSMILPFFDLVMDVIPSSSLPSFSDALRFAIQNLSPSKQLPLIDWVIKKIEKSLWRTDAEVTSNGLSDGFADQSKWVGIMCAVLIELDNVSTTAKPWSLSSLSNEHVPGNVPEASNSLELCWSNVTERLLPRMLLALGHPYQKCREQVAWCLFNICNCYAKIKQQAKHDSGTTSERLISPSGDILKSILDLAKPSDVCSKEHQLCLTTARFFMFYCLHYGDNRYEYAEFVIPLIPLAFNAIKPDSLADEKEVDSEVRMLQAQVVKGYRYSIAEISASCFVTYNNTEDITTILKSLEVVAHCDDWQVRHAAAHFLRSFQGCHKFLFTERQTKRTTRVVAKLLADDRKEVSTAVSPEHTHPKNRVTYIYLHS